MKWYIRIQILILLFLSLGFTLLKANDHKRIKVACLGASITYGVFLKNPASEAYPAQLQRMLGDIYEVTNFGVSGTTLLTNGDNAFVRTPQYRQALESNPDVVVIDLGGNDSKLINRIHLADFEHDCAELINSFRKLPSHPRIILMIPVTSFVTDTTGIWDLAIRSKVIPSLRAVAYKEHVEIIDFYSVFLGRPDLYLDGIHPNIQGATIMAQRLRELLTQERDTQFNIFQKLQVGGETSSFLGYECITFKMFDRDCKIVKPKWTNKQRSWIWRARFWGHEPQVDIALLERGYHLVYCDVAELFGNEEAIKTWNKFYNFLMRADLNKKAAMEGMSRGAIYVYNWAAENPEKVAVVYVDNPLLDLLWWPGRQYTERMPERREWDMFKKDYGFNSDEQALQFKGSPLDEVKAIAKGGYPMLHVCGDADEDVPMSKNTIPFAEKIKSLGGMIDVIVKPGFKHHPHSLPNPAPIVEFIMNAYAN
jgi:lysophospholipase L1-like esterase